jgi:DNA replicative helicase MCM subunit Mcm2 (Cdc46/Mcm family)
VVKDQVDAQMDERLASFVVDSHHRSHPANEVDELEAAANGNAAGGDAARPWQAANAIDQDTLKMYIAYAKKHCHPKLQDADTAKMVQVRVHACRACMHFSLCMTVRNVLLFCFSKTHANPNQSRLVTASTATHACNILF